MEKIKSFQITGMTISGLKSYQESTELVFGNLTIITGGNGRGKTSVADAIAFAVTGLPFFGERGIDRLHNEENPDVYIAMRFVDDTGRTHELVRTRQKNRMCITYDGGEVRQLDLKDLFGESDVFLSILNPLYFIEELGDKGKNLLELYLPVESVLEQLPPDLALALKEEPLLSPETYLKNKRADVRNLEESILHMRGQRDQAEAQGKARLQMAESAAQVKNLAARYQQEGRNYQFLSAGNPCPTCYRPIPADILPEVQAEIKKSADAILTEGKTKQAQLLELQGLDKKAADTFEQFKADDLAKWEQEADYLEARRQALAGTVPQEAVDLRRQIETLSASIEYGNLSQEEFDRLAECREELRQCSAELSAAEKAAGQPPEDIDGQIEQANQKITALKKQISNTAQYVSKRAEMLFSALKMNRVEISLYDVVKSTGEVKDAFKFTYAGRRYDRLSLSEKIRAGMEVSELMKRLTGRNYPVFVDNMESVDDLSNARPTGQVIMAKCVRGAELYVGPVNSTPAAGQQKAA